MIALLAGSTAADAGDAYCLDFESSEMIHSHASTGQVGSIVTTEKFSFGIWMKTDAPLSGGYAFLAINKDIDVVDSFAIRFFGDDNEVTLIILQDDGSNGKLFTWNVPGAPTSNQWVHYVFTFDGTASLDPLLIYQDGSDITGTVTKTVDQTSGSWAWGTTSHVDVAGDTTFTTWPTEDGFDAGNNVRIHSVFLWNDLLTAPEVTVLYNSGDGRTMHIGRDRGNYTSSSDLVLWYRLGLDPDNYGKDHSGSGIHLTEEHNLSSADRFRDSPG